MDTLHAMMERIRVDFGVQICVHDVSGITYSHASLHLPYVWLQHGCAYCWVAKRCVEEKRCMRQKQLVMWMIKRSGGQPFFGVCNAGVCEYILPVMQQGRLLAVVFASAITREDSEESARKVQLAASRLSEGLAQELMQGYERFAQECTASRAQLQFFAELIKEYLLRNSAGVARASADPYAVEAVREETGRNGVVSAILGYIESILPGPIALADISAVFFMSEGHLSRLFRQEMGMSIIAYVKRRRIQAAARYLRESGESVSAIAQRVGIADANYFCRAFKSVMGVTPTEYRSKDLDGSIQG